MPKQWLEADIERWLWHHQEAFGYAIGLYCVNERLLKWVARQFSLPRSGRVDLIGRFVARLLVVEIKNRTAKEADLIQVMRYCRELENVRQAYPNLPRWFNEDACLAQSWIDNQPTMPFVVATDFTSEAIRTSNLFDIRLIRFQTEPIQLECVDTCFSYTDYAESTEQWEAISQRGWISEWTQTAFECFCDDPTIRDRVKYLQGEQ